MRRIRLLSAITVPFALLGAVGCTATVVEASADDGPATTTQALIAFERSERDGKPAQTNIVAKFLRMPVAVDAETAESVVGSQVDLPLSGECFVVSASDIAEPFASGPIELFDVGDVTIRTASSAIPLAARAFPDVGDRVSGVFYTAPDTEGDLPAPGKYILEGSGSSWVDAFVIETEAPAVPVDVTVGGAALSDGLVLRENENVEIAWGGSPTASPSNEDLAYIEIVAENGVAARCAYEDQGRGVLPSRVLHSVIAGLDDAQPVAATLALHRVRQGAFQAAGLDAGDVRFDMSVVANITLLSKFARTP